MSYPAQYNGDDRFPYCLFDEEIEDERTAPSPTTESKAEYGRRYMARRRQVGNTPVAAVEGMQ